MRRPVLARKRHLRGSGRRRWALVAVLDLAIETAAVWLTNRRLAGEVVVSCRAGHAFTTIWIPGASLKSLRLGWWRLQYCPVGRHWTVVKPVGEASLSDQDRRAARACHDIRIP